MDKKELKQKEKILNTILKELSSASFKLDYENRLDVSSLKNNIHNVKVSTDIDYVYRFYDSNLGERFINNFEYLQQNKKDSYIVKTYEDVEELKHGIAQLVLEMYVTNVEKPKDMKKVEKKKIMK